MKRTAAAIVTLGFVASSQIASALTYKNIAGRWCGPNGTATFTPSHITFVPKNKNPTVIEQVSGYLYSDTSIQVFYFIAGGRHYYNLTDFNRGTMVWTGTSGNFTYKRC